MHRCSTHRARRNQFAPGLGMQLQLGTLVQRIPRAATAETVHLARSARALGAGPFRANMFGQVLAENEIGALVIDQRQSALYPVAYRVGVHLE